MANEDKMKNMTKIFNEYHKTHNQAVFDAYTDEMKVARHTHIVTGLPDTVWPWTYRRRLQKSCSVRYRFPDRAEEEG